ncbi:hypothetical protein M1O16_05095, partial [Dehalococcoidia bacterium]|nr:hypothetical protein [Dehalococcoidia bacterium]
MEISILVGQIWGWVLVISGLVGVLWPNVVVRWCNDKSYLILFGVVLLVLGLVTVVLHNLWVADWRVVITILGWLALILGALQIAFAKSLAQEATTKVQVQISSIIHVLVGA